MEAFRVKILLVEDDLDLYLVLKKALQKELYTIDIAPCLADASHLLTHFRYDLILLDLMLPDGNGITFCQKLRARGEGIPLIILTAKDTIMDRVFGLDSGADDYLAKPFSLAELMARIRARLRNPITPENPLALKIADLEIDQRTKKVTRGGKLILLTPKEYRLLEFLALNQDATLSEEIIKEALLDFEEQTLSNVISVYIYRLRNKIDKDHSVKLIHTLRGIGYRFGYL